MCQMFSGPWTNKQSEGPPLLLQFVELLFMPLEAAEASANYRTQIRRSVRLLEAILGRAATLEDLCTRNLRAVQFSNAIAAVGLSEGTRYTLRKRLASVWKYAAVLGYLERPKRDRSKRAKKHKATAKPQPIETEPMPGTLAADVKEMVLETAIAENSAYLYYKAVQCFGEFLGRPATRADLAEPVVNRWLKSLEGRLDPTTIHKRKRNLTPLWNWLASQNLVPFYNHRRLRRTRVQFRPVRAWSIEQIEFLLLGAKDVAGTLRCGVSATAFLRAVVLVSFDTGIRMGDLRRLRSDAVDPVSGVVRIVQHKTKNPHVARLNQKTLEALKAVDFKNRELVFPISREGIYDWCDRLYEAAAVYGFTRRKGQNIGTLRKSHATERARHDSPEAAARSLGHVSGTKTALRHYIEADAIATLEPLACIERLSNENRSN